MKYYCRYLTQLELSFQFLGSTALHDFVISLSQVCRMRAVVTNQEY